MHQDEELPTLELTRPRHQDDDDICAEDIIYTTLPVNAQTAYEVFCDLEQTPEWIYAVRSVQVLAFDESGRPTKAAYLASYGRASAGYTVEYKFEDDNRIVTWATPGGTTTRVAGRAMFQPLTERSTMMHYQLEVNWPSGFGVSAGFYDEHPASAALNDFRDFITRRYVLC